MVPRRLERLDWIELVEGERAYVAATWWARLVGLAWLGDLAAGCALLIPRCRSVHTFGMRFAIDVDFLDAEGRVVGRRRAVPPRRVVRCRGAVAALERKAVSAAPGARGRP